MNLGVGGLDFIGDLIELVESGDGLKAGVFRKTRAGGNWLIGGIETEDVDARLYKT